MTNEQTRTIIDLIAELKKDCNKEVNGQCTTLACLKRGGYKVGDSCNVATCDRLKQINALQAALGWT